MSHGSVPNHPDHKLAKKLLPNGAGSMIAFGIKGGKEAEKHLSITLNLLHILLMLGYKNISDSSGINTHSQMDEAT